MTSKFGTTVEPLVTEPTAVTGMQSTVSGQAASVLDQLKSPFADAAGPVSNNMPSGFYSVHCSYLTEPTTRAKIKAQRVGGRFFFADSSLEEWATKALTNLVKKGLATHESDDLT